MKTTHLLLQAVLAAVAVLAATPVQAELFLNAVILGPGLGTQWSAPW